MKKNEVKIGETYRAKVSGTIANVRITGENPYGGWDGINVATKRKVRIKSAQRLRGRVAPKRTATLIVGKDEAEAKAETPQVVSSTPGGETAAVDPKPREKAERADGKMSGLDAAAKVLAEAAEPLNCQAIVERALAQGYWQTAGKTPSATVYAAIVREIAQKGDASRFAKAGRGKFTLAGKKA